jgi:hypothetical protein
VLVRIVLGVVVLAGLLKVYEVYWEYRKGRREGKNPQ